MDLIFSWTWCVVALLSCYELLSPCLNVYCNGTSSHWGTAHRQSNLLHCFHWIIIISHITWPVDVRSELRQILPMHINTVYLSWHTVRSTGQRVSFSCRAAARARYWYAVSKWLRVSASIRRLQSGDVHESSAGKMEESRQIPGCVSGDVVL